MQAEASTLNCGPFTKDLMEEFAIELNPAVVQLERLSARERVAAYLELTKPRITFLIVLTAAAGFALASPGRVDYRAMLTAMVGIALLSSGIATLNQYMENGEPATADWQASSLGSARVWRRSYSARRNLSGSFSEPTECGTRLDRDLRIFIWLHATQNADFAFNFRRRFSRRGAAAHRLGQRAGHDRC